MTELHEIEQLRAWKRDAIRVLTDWEDVWETLGRPGPPGASKAASSLTEIRRLTGERGCGCEPTTRPSVIS